ncbi:3-hydroxybutyryl-CoA dehydrogenase [Propionicimonas sp. T2.31MG-18]|uniref:3-hydroxyacyl-CoA dehydrogenase n=1 Tax=Propionicimonas sp. T2.31MG-18 TaxID=3157620 RepID=UPI0035F0DE55
MDADDIRTVLVVGAGTMGQQIALQCAAHGFAVTLLDTERAALDRARARLDALAGHVASDPAFAHTDVVADVARISATTDPAEAAHEADLVSESVPEDPALKGRVFAELDRLCPARTIFATNTSSLVPSLFADATGRPDRLAALHFHQPVWSATIVDVMPHPGTSPETVETLVGFAGRIGQVPIRLLRESPGYVFNAMYNALNREAITLAANGVATVEDIDRAWTTVTKMPNGPFGMLDHVGIDTAWHITDYWARTLGDPQLTRNAAFLKGYLDQGRAGVKSGRGFYDYR